MKFGTLAKIAGGARFIISNSLRLDPVSRRPFSGLAAQKKSGFKAKAIFGLLMLAGGIYLAFKIFGLAVSLVVLFFWMLWKLVTFVLPIVILAGAVYAGWRFFTKR